MPSATATRLFRVSLCLLAGIGFLAVATDVSFAVHRHHSGKSSAVAGDAKRFVSHVSTPPNVNAPSRNVGGGQPSPGPDASLAAKHGPDQGDKGLFERAGKKPPNTSGLTKGDRDASRTRFHRHAFTPGTKGGAKARAGVSSPIDLSITMQPGRSFKKVSRPADAKKTLGGPMENFSTHKQTLAPDGKFGPVRNAVGVRLEGSAKGTGPDSGPAVDLTAKNVPGGNARTNTSRAGGESSRQGLNVVIQGGIAAYNGVVSGNLVRPGFGPGSVGGAAKNMPGINGTVVRPRRCLGGC